MRRVLSCRSVMAALAALLLGGEVAAQEGAIAGRVTDAATLEAVAGARIRVVGGESTAEVTSRADGTFELSLPPGTFDLVVEADGFLPRPFYRLRVPPGQTLTQNLPLQSQAFLLDGFIVTARRLPESSGLFDTELTAPSASHSIGARQVLERPTPNPVDHVREAPAVDIGTLGIQSSNVVVRGFNNIFSGALHLMTDYRLAGLPGLRVNYAHFLPLTAWDVERIEVVSGSGSALYGPNTANGVLHVITRSPFDDPGTRVSLAAGERSALQGAFRSGLVVGDELALKLSGSFMRGREWTYYDPAEGLARDSAIANPDRCITDRVVRGLNQEAAAEACGRIGDRDFDAHRYGLEARADWRFSDRGSFIATYGVTDVSGIELTPLSASQVDSWRNQFVQGRFSYDRWAIQAYLNFSESGDVFLLRDGVDLIDKSTLGVFQVQNGFSLADGRQDFTYGFDYFSTRPESQGTIYGAFESDNDISEWGVFLQSKTEITSRLDLFAAARIDAHSVLPDKVFSPRLAMVFQPNEDHAFRASYNRAFSTPTALNHFLDLGAGFAPADPDLFGLEKFSARASGTGRNGFSWRNPDGGYWMRSPYNRPEDPEGSRELLTADRATVWALGLQAYDGQLPEEFMARLRRLDPEDIGVGFYAGAGVLPLDSFGPQDVPAIKETTSETFEVGWSGVFNEALRLSVDGYYRRQFDFVSPLTTASPLFLVDLEDLGQAYASLRVPELVQDGLSVEDATAEALAEFSRTVLPVASTTPLAVGVSDLPGQREAGADIIQTYRNIDEVLDVWGVDASLQWLVTPRWTVSATYSHVSQDLFEIEGSDPIALNAPTDKGTLGVAYRDEVRGWNASARVRYSDAFPFRATVFEGEIDAFALVDLTLGYRIPRSAATVQLGVSNVLNEAYTSFIGAPSIGRLAMLRVTYEF